MIMTLALLTGIWTTTCIQTQIAHNQQGFAKEIYEIKATGEFEFKREWFTDSACKIYSTTDFESGTIEVGKEIKTFFNTDKTYEANFSTQGGIDLGAVAVKDSRFLKVARGMKNSSMRNTMVGLFEYQKTTP